MSPKTHPLVQQLLQSFEGIDFWYQYDAGTREHLFKLADPALYHSEAFQAFRNKALLDSIQPTKDSILFLDPADELTVLEEAIRYQSAPSGLSNEC